MIKGGEVIKPPFTKRALGAQLFGWSQDLEIAYVVCERHGCQLVRSDAEYQVAKVIGDGVKLVIFPHRTTARNYHLRVRDESSKNPARALEIARELYSASGNNCTFQMKNGSATNLRKRAGVK